MPAIHVSQHHMDVVNHLMQMLSLKSKTKLIEAAIEDYEKKTTRAALAERIRKSAEKCAELNAQENEEISQAAIARWDDFGYEP